jgi:phospholipid/cholesterol/gamma-HCH transport system ATP-binding protein
VSDAPVIVCRGVGKRFGRQWVLRDVDLDVRPGELLGIFGPGGHGKSVLLRLMAGLTTPDEGTVEVRGKNLATVDGFELSKLRRDYGYLFQNYALFDFMNVADNVAFPLRQVGGVPEDEIAQRVRERLTQLGLGHALDRFPNELSGGMKKRVGMARATIAEPRIVLYDDPSAGLDPVTSSKISSW